MIIMCDLCDLKCVCVWEEAWCVCLCVCVFALMCGHACGVQRIASGVFHFKSFLLYFFKKEANYLLSFYILNLVATPSPPPIPSSCPPTPPLSTPQRG